MVRTPEGNVDVDPTGKRNGRGAYLCANPACWEKAFEDRPTQPRLQHVPDRRRPSRPCGSMQLRYRRRRPATIADCRRGSLMANTYQGGARRSGGASRGGRAVAAVARGGGRGRGRSGGRSSGARTVAMKRVMPVERSPVSLPPSWRSPSWPNCRPPVSKSSKS